MKKLNNCKFCGNKPKLYEWGWPNGGSTTTHFLAGTEVKCECGAKGPYHGWDGFKDLPHDKTIEQWNEVNQ